MDPIRKDLEALAAADLIHRVEALEAAMQAQNTPAPPPPAKVHDGRRRTRKE